MADADQSNQTAGAPAEQPAAEQRRGRAATAANEPTVTDATAVQNEQPATDAPDETVEERVNRQRREQVQNTATGRPA